MRLGNQLANYVLPRFRDVQGHIGITCSLGLSIGKISEGFGHTRKEKKHRSIWRMCILEVLELPRDCACHGWCGVSVSEAEFNRWMSIKNGVRGGPGPLELRDRHRHARSIPIPAFQAPVT